METTRNDEDRLKTLEKVVEAVGVAPRATTVVVARSLTTTPKPERAERVMVEAVGVEPTSERPVAAELYMLIRP